jgi:hypothetical protein
LLPSQEELLLEVLLVILSVILTTKLLALSLSAQELTLSLGLSLHPEDPSQQARELIILTAPSQQVAPLSTLEVLQSMFRAHSLSPLELSLPHQET